MRLKPLGFGGTVPSSDPDFTGSITLTPLEGNGGLKQNTYNSSVLITNAATATISIEIPTGVKIIGVQIHVKSALAGGETWDAELNDGAQLELICENQAVAKNTNVNSFSLGVITGGTTDIIISPNGGGVFTAQGEIEATVYVWEFVDWDDD